MLPERSSFSEARVAEDLADGEVPAAVVCARCGNADCAGCTPELYRSGVVAVVPWERPGLTIPSRMWATARAATFDADSFFETLPDGPLDSALSFAVLAETIAVAAMSVALFVPLGLMAPGGLRQLIVQRWDLVLRLWLAGGPLIGLMLVLAHVAHGWALHVGTPKAARTRGGRCALRFGLYSAGWDLVIGPLGAVAAVLREGPVAALAILGLAQGLPTRSAKAFLRGHYGLVGEQARPALRASLVAAILVTFLGALAVLVAVTSAILL